MRCRGEHCLPAGVLQWPLHCRVVEDADPLHVGADSISAREGSGYGNSPRRGEGTPPYVQRESYA